MDRAHMLASLRKREEAWDLVIIGGGATGVGIAVDAASRGYAVCLLERSDFGQGTSSRSTKLIHGGVRYLQQGNIPLVMESLHERGLLRQNAPHLVEELPFIIPDYAWWEKPFYGVGMKVYDVLAGRYGFSVSELLSKEEVLERIPTLRQDHLRGGTLYYDGQFDDARLLVNLARTAAEQGAVLLNHMPVTGLVYDDRKMVCGVTCRESETGEVHTLLSKCVVNATGPFTDMVRKMDDPVVAPIMAPSQGVYRSPAEFLPGDSAIMVPHTSDGRVMFAIPWRGHTLIGTTDTPVQDVPVEPVPFSAEVDFILETAAPYFTKQPTRADIQCAFAGIRPLARGNHEGDTASLSRDFVIDISPSGLLTMTGGKWTTYRKMAEECVDHAITLANLEARPCLTRTLNIHGYYQYPDRLGSLRYYGTDAFLIQELMESDTAYAQKIHPSLSETVAEVVWAVRFEMARTVDDILSRRLRITFLDTKLAVSVAPVVATILARELGRDAQWQRQQVEEFTALAQGFLVEKI
jgi:glycerol-3-phosphate dehydrogenase